MAYRYREECYGSSGGQTDCSILAYEDNQQIAHLDVAYYTREGRKEAYIKMVEVQPTFRGKGVGRDLIRQLAQRVPYEAIDWGGTTSDGSALKKVMDQEFGTSYKPIERDEEPDPYDPKYSDDLDNKRYYGDLEAWRKRQGYVDENLLRENLNALEAKYQDKLDKFWVSERGRDIELAAIVVKKEYRNQGIGSQVMKDLCAYADSVQKIISLTPDKVYGGTVSRLKDFYKSFGFVENKGKNKDYGISNAMYRPPTPKEGNVMKVKELKQLIGQMVKEAFLREYAQGGFDLNAFKQLPTEAEMIAYAQKAGLPLLGKGSSRVVFQLSDDQALKIARKPESRVQNVNEVKAFECLKRSKNFAQIYDSDPEGKWLIVERAVENFSVGAEEGFLDLFNKQAGTSLTVDNYPEFFELMNVTNFPAYLKSTQMTPELQEVVNQYQQAIRSSQWFRQFKSLIQGCKVSSRDFKPDNWGRMKDGRLALVDYGFSMK